MKSLMSYTSTPYYFPFFLVVHYHNDKAMIVYISPSTINCVLNNNFDNIKFYAL